MCPRPYLNLPESIEEAHQECDGFCSFDPPPPKKKEGHYSLAQPSSNKSQLYTFEGFVSVSPLPPLVMVEMKLETWVYSSLQMQ